MPTMILVCGGRDFTDSDLLDQTLDRLRTPALTIIHGDARGADRLAGAWAKKRSIDVVACPADWEHYGKSAGPVRNRAMLAILQGAVLDGRKVMVMAFAGGHGTAHMVRIAQEAGIDVVMVG